MLFLTLRELNKHNISFRTHSNRAKTCTQEDYKDNRPRPTVEQTVNLQQQVPKYPILDTRMSSVGRPICVTLTPLALIMKQWGLKTFDQ